MVIGNGLLAGAFKDFEQDNNVLIFASGVSNSKNTSDADFKREIDLLENYLPFQGLLVYFSTCSVYDPGLSQSNYIKHKKHIEGLIKNKTPNYLITRLPNVVGPTDNPHTMFNFFINQLLSNQQLKIQSKASRYLIDISDVSEHVANKIQSNRNMQETINFIISERISVERIVQILAESIDVKANYTLIEGGDDYVVPKSDAYQLLSNNNLIAGETYFRQILKKECYREIILKAKA